MKKVFAWASVVLVSGCAALIEHPTRAERESAVLGEAEARKTFVNCAARQVYLLDDKASDAATVALAATNMCQSDYSRWVEDFAASRADNENQLVMIRNQMHAPRYKAQVALPLVLRNRSATASK